MVGQSYSMLMDKVQKLQAQRHRHPHAHWTLVRALVGPLLRGWADPERRRALLLRVAGSSAGFFTLALLLEVSRGVCRTPMESLRLLALLVHTIGKTVTQIVARGGRPKFPKWTLRFEVLRGIMHLVANTHGERIVDEQHARTIRRHSEVMGSSLGWFARVQHGLDLQSVQVNDLEHLWLKSPRTKTAASNAKRLVLLFFHGGGYAVLSPRMYIAFCSSLATAIKREFVAQADVNGASSDDIVVDVFLANYRKVPEHKFPVPVQDAVTMYEYLLQHEGLSPSQIILAGDSTGGGLVMSTLLRVRDGSSSWKPKLELPLAAMALCPFVDLTGDENAISGQHCVLSPNITNASRVHYHPTPEDPASWADASSVHCDLRGLPPVLVQTATQDLIYQHALRLAAKAKVDGVTNWELDVHEGVPHVFMVFPSFVLPYASVGVEKMASFAARRFHRSLLTEQSGDEAVVDTEKLETTSNVVEPASMPTAA